MAAGHRGAARSVPDQAPHIPLGQVLQPSADSTRLTRLLDGFPQVWNVRKG